MSSNANLKKQKEEKIETSKTDITSIFGDLLKGNDEFDIKVKKYKDIKELKEGIINLINVNVAPMSTLKYTLYRKNVNDVCHGEIGGTKSQKILKFVDILLEDPDDITALNIKIEQEDIRYSSVDGINYLFIVM